MKFPRRLPEVYALLLVAASLVMLRPLSSKPAMLSAPAGTSSAGFSLLRVNGEGPAAWDCSRPIGVALNASTLSPSERELLRQDVESAFAEIAKVSSFRFVLRGDTDLVPNSSWGSKWYSLAPQTPVVIAVVAEGDSDLAFTDASASGGGFTKPDVSDRLRITAGFVLLHLDEFNNYRPGSGFMSRQALLLHELLHVLNVGHSEHSSSVMTPSLADSYGTLGPSDVAALKDLSRTGCSLDK